jgi:hypothetical protein
MKMNLPRSAPVVALVAAGCLLLGSTGGAVAGALITGKQIKDNTVTTKDIKNGSLAVKDLSKKTRSALAGTPGPAGATGPAGAAGPRGFSAWDTIPSGQTVTGRFYNRDVSGASTAPIAENIEYPAKAPAAAAGYGFGPDSFGFTPDDPQCTGTYAAPTAPAGRVCVYVDGADGLADVSIGQWSAPAHRPYTFYLSYSPTAADAAFEVWGSWAYTAP